MDKLSDYDKAVAGAKETLTALREDGAAAGKRISA